MYISIKNHRYCSCKPAHISCRFDIVQLYNRHYGIKDHKRENTKKA